MVDLFFYRDPEEVEFRLKMYSIFVDLFCRLKKKIKWPFQVKIAIINNKQQIRSIMMMVHP